MSNTFFKNTALQYLLFALLSTLIIVMVIKWPIGEWMTTLWLNDYQEGFIKRGFAGEVLSLISPTKAGKSSFIHTVMVFILAVLSLLILAFGFKFLRTSPSLILILLLSGFGLQQFSYDVGRFDQPNYVLGFIALFVIFSNWRPWFIYTLVQAFLLLMLLIHEASVFMIMPVLLVAMFFRFTNDDARIKLITVFILVSAMATLVVVFGGNIEKSPEEFAVIVAPKASDFEVDQGALSVQTSTLKTNIIMTLKRLTNKKTFSRMLRIFLVSFPFFLIIRLWFKQLRPYLNKEESLLLFFPTLAMLPLFVIGIDFYRWLAMMFFNTVLVFAIASYVKKQRLDISKGYYIAAIIAGIYCGPFGVSIGMPDRLALLGR